MIPGFVGMVPVFPIGRKLGLSDATMGIASLISMAIFASFFYGAIALIVIRIRTKNKSIVR
ncbi:MAG: hypothetical protein M3N41_04335 [Acidobacteriota bacterium]|nr:hypothetical protein [Acidobacteriota bacterium]